MEKKQLGKPQVDAVKWHYFDERRLITMHVGKDFVSHHSLGFGNRTNHQNGFLINNIDVRVLPHLHRALEQSALWNTSYANNRQLAAVYAVPMYDLKSNGVMRKSVLAIKFVFTSDYTPAVSLQLDDLFQRLGPVGTHPNYSLIDHKFLALAPYFRPQVLVLDRTKYPAITVHQIRPADIHQARASQAVDIPNINVFLPARISTSSQSDWLTTFLAHPTVLPPNNNPFAALTNDQDVVSQEDPNEVNPTNPYIDASQETYGTGDGGFTNSQTSAGKVFGNAQPELPRLQPPVNHPTNYTKMSRNKAKAMAAEAAAAAAAAAQAALTNNGAGIKLFNPISTSTTSYMDVQADPRKRLLDSELPPAQK